MQVIDDGRDVLGPAEDVDEVQAARPRASTSPRRSSDGYAALAVGFRPAVGVTGMITR
jgi:hypothetical protein